MREFNSEGTCIPENHYYVNPEETIEILFQMIEKGKYFTLSRPRQYGKTTLLYLLNRFLIHSKTKYLSIKLSFKGIGSDSYQSEKNFNRAFLARIKRNLSQKNQPKLLRLLQEREGIETLVELSDLLTELIEKAGKKVILMIDEVDKSSNNQLFLDFLGMLREKYLLQKEGEDLSFHSVILAGVHDVKTISLKYMENKEEKFNSPWNIAVDFQADLSFSSAKISLMLEEYKQEKKVEMDASAIAQQLHYYTSGHPFLVSRLCEIMDTYDCQWDLDLVDRGVQQLLKEKNSNFESLVKNLENNQELRGIVQDLILEGERIGFNLDHPIISLGLLYGIFRNQEGTLKVHNRIYEQRIYNYLSSKLELAETKNPFSDFQKHFFNKDGSLDMKKTILKFQEFMKQQTSKWNQDFLERNGRLIFLAFLKPIINGKGFDFKEVEISDEKRLDVVVTYLNQRHVIELKLWRGEEAHQNGIQQLYDYLDRLNQNIGYLLIFDFRKSKKWQQETIQVKEKEIMIAWV